MDDEDYEGGGYDDGISTSEVNYRVERWDPTETGGLLIAGRQVRNMDLAITWAELKAAVAAVEAVGDGVTLVLPGDTTETGPSDAEDARYSTVVVGVVVSATQANDPDPLQLDRERPLRAVADYAKRDHAAIAAALPAGLAAAYLAAADELLLVPVGPLPYVMLVRGVHGVASSTGRPGTFYRGVDMAQEGHAAGVWGERLTSGQYSDVVPIDLPELAPDAGAYWLIACYD